MEPREREDKPERREAKAKDLYAFGWMGVRLRGKGYVQMIINFFLFFFPAKARVEGGVTMNSRLWTD